MAKTLENKGTGKTKPSAQAEEARKKRQAEALRNNLRRRKAAQQPGDAEKP